MRYAAERSHQEMTISYLRCREETLTLSRNFLSIAIASSVCCALERRSVRFSISNLDILSAGPEFIDCVSMGVSEMVSGSEVVLHGLPRADRSEILVYD